MKNAFFLLLLVLLGGISLQAQQTESAAPAASAAPGVNDQEIRKITETLTSKYSLNADQAKQMYTIQARKARNMAQIAAFKDSDPALFRAKVLNVQKSTLANIRSILNTKEQVDLYQKTQTEIRSLRNRKQKELATKKASKAEIDAALIAIYAE